MRIIHAVRSDRFAGVEAHICGLAATQAASGHQVWVIGGDPAAMRTRLGGHGVTHLTAHRVFDVARGLTSLRDVDADIVHAHMTAAEIPAALVPVARARVTTRHFAAPRGSSPTARYVAAQCARRFAAQIAVSAYVASHIESSSVVIHSGVDNRPLVPPADRVRALLLVQRLEAEKHSADALSAFARSGLDRQGWRLWIAGNGSRRDALRSLAHELQVEDRVDFLGHRSDARTLMDEASLMIAPTAVEAFGLAVVEAMSCGLPVIAAGSGAHLETVGSVQGSTLFSPGDVGEAARQLRALADDPGRRAAYGASLRDAQRARFTLEHQARQTDEVYRSVL